MRHTDFLSLGAMLTLSACASSGDYPTLQRRAAERVSGSAEPIAPIAAPPASEAPSPELAQRLTGLVAQARAAQDKFASQRSRTESLVGAAAGAGMASEGWSVATVAVANLEGARSEALIALAELDQLYLADRIAHVGAPGADSAAIAAAWEQVLAIVAGQDAALARIKGRLRS